MLDATARVLSTGIFGPGAATNAFLESFTVHVRALLQFVAPTSPKPDDVLAEDFFDSREAWLQIRGELPAVLADVNRRVGKEIAHLTYARQKVTPEAKNWDVRAIWEALGELLQRFAEHALAERLGSSWQRVATMPEA